MARKTYLAHFAEEPPATIKRVTESRTYAFAWRVVYVWQDEPARSVHGFSISREGATRAAYTGWAGGYTIRSREVVPAVLVVKP